MELKYNKDWEKANGTLCSNCTFMELKSVHAVNAPFAVIVLIVPLWN